MNSRIRKSIDLIVYLLIFIAFYLLNRFSLFITDDYYYAFVMKEGLYGDMIYEPIQNLSDIIRSQQYAYFNHNGRFIVHSIVQLFCGILGMKIFVIINSLVFLFLVIGMTRIVRYYRPTFHYYDVIINFLFLFLCIPLVGRTFLGNVSFSVNYLWTSCAIIWWYYLYLANRSNNIVVNCLLLLFSVFVGAMQESFSIGIAAALCIYYIFNFKQLKGVRLCLVLGFILGACIVTLAPANFTRFSSEQGGTFSLKQIALQIVRVLLSLRVSLLVVIILIIKLIRNYNNTCRMLINNKSVILIIACVVNIVFAAIIAMNGKHQLVCVELFSILVLILNIDFNIGKVWENELLIFICCILISIFIYVPIYKCREEYYTAHQILLEEAYECEEGIVVGDKYESLCFNSPGRFLDKYIMRDHYWDFNRKGLSLFLTRGQDVSFIKSILPASIKTILASCVTENQIADCVYKADANNYYVVRVESENIEDCKAEVYLQPGFIGKFIYKYLNRATEGADCKDYPFRLANRFYYNGYWYVIVSDTSSIKSVKFL